MAACFIGNFLDFSPYDFIAWAFILFNIFSFFKIANSTEIIRKIALSGLCLSAFGAYVSLFVWKINLSSVSFGRGQVLTGDFDYALFDKGIFVFCLGFLLSFISLMLLQKEPSIASESTISRTKKQWRPFLILTASMLLVVYIVSRFCPPKLDPNFIGNVLLGLTFIAILWYTVETRRLANLTEKQIKINTKPIIVVKNIVDSLELKNIGRSPALNITIKDIIRKDANNNLCHFEFTKIDECGAGEKRGSGITPYLGDSAIRASGKAHGIKLECLLPGFRPENESYELFIDYNDVEMGKWRSITLVDNKGLHFKEIKDLK